MKASIPISTARTLAELGPVWDKYGVQDSIYGWEIDHIYPKSKLEARGFRAELIDGPLTVNEATRKVLAQMFFASRTCFTQA